jgi:membrane-associated protein
VLPIVPSEAVVIAASILATRGEVSIWLVALAAAAAARRLFRSPKAKHRLTWAGEALERHGATIIVVARFVPGGRTATTFTAGIVGLARAVRRRRRGWRELVGSVCDRARLSRR